MSTNGTVAVPAALPPIPPNIAQIAAPVLIGILVSWGFWGMLVVQVYIYAVFFKDKLFTRCFVYGVFLIDTLQTFMHANDAFYWFASGFGDMTHLGDVYLSGFDTPGLGGLLAILGQAFFCYRIYVLGRSIWLPLFLFTICIVSLVGAWFGAVHGYVVKGSLEDAQAAINLPALYVWLISSMVSDVLIAGSMTYLLLRNRGHHKQTDAVLNRLVMLTMETNSISAFLAILTLVLYYAKPGTSYFLTPTYALGKCYANALLVTLNNRHFIMIRNNGGHRGSGSTSALMAPPSQSKGGLSMGLRDLSRTLGDTPSEYETPGVKIQTFKSTVSTRDSFHLSSVGSQPNALGKSRYEV